MRFLSFVRTFLVVSAMFSSAQIVAAQAGALSITHVTIINPTARKKT